MTGEERNRYINTGPQMGRFQVSLAGRTGERDGGEQGKAGQRRRMGKREGRGSGWIKVIRGGGEEERSEKKE